MRANTQMNIMENQIIAAEITAGLLVTMACRIISKNLFFSERMVPGGDGAQFETTRSLVCVWLASNVKFLLFKKGNSSVSLTAHASSRLVASLALVLCTCSENIITRGPVEQLPLVDVAIFLFLVVSSVTLISLDRRHIQGFVKLHSVFSDPQKFFLQMDFLATFVFGFLWVLFPDWLLGSQITESENGLQLHLTRAFGAMMVGDSFVSFAIQNRHSKAEASKFSSRALGTIVLLIFLIRSQFTVATWSTGRVWFALVGASLWTGNSILGYLNSGQVKNISADQIYKCAAMRNTTTCIVHQ